MLSELFHVHIFKKRRFQGHQKAQFVNSLIPRNRFPTLHSTPPVEFIAQTQILPPKLNLRCSLESAISFKFQHRQPRPYRLEGIGAKTKRKRIALVKFTKTGGKRRSFDTSNSLQRPVGGHITISIPATLTLLPSPLNFPLNLAPPIQWISPPTKTHRPKPNARCLPPHVVHSPSRHAYAHPTCRNSQRQRVAPSQAGSVAVVPAEDSIRKLLGWVGVRWTSLLRACRYGWITRPVWRMCCCHQPAVCSCY